MTTPAMISRISAYFGGDGKPYNSEVVSEITRVLDNLGDEDRNGVWARLVEDERANFKIGVKEIVTACQALGISYHRSRRVDSQEWECDACGRAFRYSPCTDSDDHFAGTFDYCPRCGFQPGWTITVMAYARDGRLSPGLEAWYKTQRAKSQAEHPEGKEPFWSPGREREGIDRINREQAARMASIMSLLGEKTIRRAG